MKRTPLMIGVLLLTATGLTLLAQAPALPGTSVDRVGMPAGYRDTFKLLYSFDNNQGRQIRAVYANDAALSVDQKQPYNFPYGSIFIFEDYPAVLDSAGEPVVDENGRFVRGDLRTIFVMRKEKGFGDEYKEIRNGEWEYVSYLPNGTFATTPQNSGSCALCHLRGSSLALTNDLPPANSTYDYVFRAKMYFNGGNGALPDAVALNYKFVPGVIHVKAGSTVTLYNSDEIVHNFVADDN
jgi:hypothetical protein